MTKKLDPLAEVAVANLANITMTARVGRFYDDALSLPYSGRNDATELMAKNEWVTNPILANTAFCEPVQIGAA